MVSDFGPLPQSRTDGGALLKGLERGAKPLYSPPPRKLMLEGLPALNQVVADRHHFPLAFVQRMVTRNPLIGIFIKRDLNN